MTDGYTCAICGKHIIDKGGSATHKRYCQSMLLDKRKAEKRADGWWIRCRKCGEMKHESAFHPFHCGILNRRQPCIECDRKRRRRQQREKAEKLKKPQSPYRKIIAEFETLGYELQHDKAPTDQDAPLMVIMADSGGYVVMPHEHLEDRRFWVSGSTASSPCDEKVIAAIVLEAEK